jgi:hypothetical protein
MDVPDENFDFVGEFRNPTNGLIYGIWIGHPPIADGIPSQLVASVWEMREEGNKQVEVITYSRLP